MTGPVWYYKIFFYLIELCIKCTHFGKKISNHTTRTALDFRKSLISELIEGNMNAAATRTLSPPGEE